MSSPALEFLSSVTLVARDPHSLSQFYRDLLQLRFQRDEYGYPAAFYFSSFNETQIAIHPRENFPEFDGEPFGARLAFETPDLEATTAHAESLGLEVHWPASRRAPAVRTASVRDPEGNEITFTNRPDWWHLQIAGLRRHQLAGVLKRNRRGWLKSLHQLLRIRWSLFQRWVQFQIIDPWAYRNDRIFLRHRDLRPYTHLVTSREGVFAIRQDGFQKILRGQFFGLTVRDGDLYLFQANGPLVSKVRHGRILRVRQEDGVIRGVDVVAKDLDNGCHQIDFLGDRLVVMDTYHQKVIRFSPDFQQREILQPLADARSGQWEKGYAHANSIVQYRGDIYILKHNGSMNTGRNSELVRLDQEYRILEVLPLPGAMGHNIVFLEDGRLLVCDSRGGTLIDRQGVVVSVGGAFTRGISVDRDTLVVGESAVADRRTRQLFSTGRAYFYDRDYRLRGTLDLPAAVTEIRRIDGNDLSLSNCPRD